MSRLFVSQEQSGLSGLTCYPMEIIPTIHALHGHRKMKLGISQLFRLVFLQSFEFVVKACFKIFFYLKIY